MKKIKSKINKIINLCLKPYMRILPGNFTYSLMMSLIPILSIIVMLSGIFRLSPSSVFDKIGNVIPEDVLTMILGFLGNNTWGNILVIIAGVWAASSGPNALIIASNMIYNFDGDPSFSSYLKRRIKSILLTFLVVLVVIINLLVLVFGNHLLNLVFNFFGLDTSIIGLFSFIKWPIALILIYFIIKVLYTACPNEKILSKTTTKGAIFTTLSWLFSSAIYSYYATNFANYSKIYGSLANIIILMIWLYILSYILMVGIAINASNYKEELKKDEVNKTE